MNLKTRIDNRLWQFIQNNYESEDYSGAILDAIHYLSNLIREKSGLECVARRQVFRGSKEVVMLTTIRIGNFKVFAETQVIPIKPITLIFGANIAGTSSIIHCLALVHEAQPKILIPNPDVLGPSRVKQALSKHQAGTKQSQAESR